ncbi:ABC transporter substrate-binding protein [Lentzea sp. NPDC005914]|uniref:ABC transporter substrate-binding protein n=1 Tax=Lentzea sp. NPDC005914 TaxID=3154572 RepID=UPI0033DB67A3
MRKAVSALLIGLAVAGCAGQAEHVNLQKVNYLTSFNTFGRDAYVYVAKEKGYFEQAGLDVTITPGTGSVDVLKLVAAGRADFGIADFTATAITVAKEKLPVTAIAAIHQKSLAAIVALEGNGISKPADLVGKKIGDQPGSTNQVMFPVYAKAAGIDPAKVEFVPSAPPALPQLLAAGQVDGIGQFVVGKPLIEAAAKGKKAVVLPYGDLVPDLYGNVLVTSKDYGLNKAPQASNFMNALLRGLEYAIAHPDEVGPILKKYQPTQDAGVAGTEVGLMAPYVKPDGYSGRVGGLTEARVQKIVRTLVDAGAIPDGSVKPDDLAMFGLAPK